MRPSKVSRVVPRNKTFAPAAGEDVWEREVFASSGVYVKVRWMFLVASCSVRGYDFGSRWAGRGVFSDVIVYAQIFDH